MYDRDNFYGNLLKRVVVRIDYEDIINVENFIKMVKNLLPEAKHIQRLLNEEDFSFNDPISKTDIPIDIIKTVKCHGFIHVNEKLESVIEINQFFIRIMYFVEKNQYNGFDKEILNRIIPIFDLLDEKEHLRITRVSVNKINQAVFASIEKIKKYFNSNLLMLNIFNRQIKWDKPQSSFSSHCNFTYNDIPVNFSVVFNRVKIDQRKTTYYRIYLNYESYLNELEINTNIRDELTKLNENCFKMFVESLRPKTKEILKQGVNISDYELD